MQIFLDAASFKCRIFLIQTIFKSRLFSDAGSFRCRLFLCRLFMIEDLSDVSYFLDEGYFQMQTLLDSGSSNVGSLKTLYLHTVSLKWNTSGIPYLYKILLNNCVTHIHCLKEDTYAYFDLFKPFLKNHIPNTVNFKWNT